MSLVDRRMAVQGRLVHRADSTAAARDAQPPGGTVAMAYYVCIHGHPYEFVFGVYEETSRLRHCPRCGSTRIRSCSHVPPVEQATDTVRVERGVAARLLTLLECEANRLREAGHANYAALLERDAGELRRALEDSHGS